ncbi:glutaredoxin domain-containing protein [Streptosporangium sp. NPDC051022]|uniref:glutaredoxin domain-containing protein n=1 Tax=Streptosporangium sp. NPDC051022 TaxID=3155752 RepID=UPI00341CC710
MLVLFQRETCPYCKPVRELLTRLQISYINVNVPKPREQRHELIRVTGSRFIPALVDGATVLPGKLEDNAHILAYLAERHADLGNEGTGKGRGTPPEPPGDTCATP